MYYVRNLERRFTWKQRKTQPFCVPCFLCNSEELNVTIFKFLYSVRILGCKMRINHGRCCHGKHSLIEAFFCVPWVYRNFSYLRIEFSDCISQYIKYCTINRQSGCRQSFAQILNWNTGIYLSCVFLFFLLNVVNQRPEKNTFNDLTYAV